MKPIYIEMASITRLLDIYRSRDDPQNHSIGSYVLPQDDIFIALWYNI
jgi:hypothetical protein